MKRRLFPTVVLLVTAMAPGVRGEVGPGPSTAAAAGTATEGEARLGRADAYLSPPGSFVAEQEVLFFKERRKEREMRVRVHGLHRPDLERHDLLVVIVEPESDRGKALLRQGELVWFSSPRGRAATKVPARHGVAGRLTISDLMRAAYLESYRPVDGGVEEIRLSSDRTVEATRLGLEARPGSTGDPRLELFLDRSDDRPLMARAFDKRDRLLKTFFFRDYQLLRDDQVLGNDEAAAGSELPMTVVVVQATGKQVVHEIQTTSIRRAAPPVDWFDPERLIETSAEVLAVSPAAVPEGAPDG